MLMVKKNDVKSEVNDVILIFNNVAIVRA